MLATAGFPTPIPSIWLTVERTRMNPSKSQVLLIVLFCRKMFLVQTAVAQKHWQENYR